jgi:hypothetical protein
MVIGYFFIRAIGGYYIGGYFISGYSINGYW